MWHGPYSSPDLSTQAQMLSDPNQERLNLIQSRFWAGNFDGCWGRLRWAGSRFGNFTAPNTHDQGRLG